MSEFPVISATGVPVPPSVQPLRLNGPAGRGLKEPTLPVSKLQLFATASCCKLIVSKDAVPPSALTSLINAEIAFEPVVNVRTFCVKVEELKVALKSAPPYPEITTDAVPAVAFP